MTTFLIICSLVSAFSLGLYIGATFYGRAIILELLRYNGLHKKFKCSDVALLGAYYVYKKNHPHNSIGNFLILCRGWHGEPILSELILIVSEK